MPTLGSCAGVLIVYFMFDDAKLLNNNNTTKYFGTFCYVLVTFFYSDTKKAPNTSDSMRLGRTKGVPSVPVYGADAVAYPRLGLTEEVMKNNACCLTAGVSS